MPTPPTESELHRRYLQLSLIPFHEDEEGRIWLTELWYQDFVRQLSYLPDYTLVAPKLPYRGEASLVPVEPELAARVRWVDAGPMQSTAGALLHAPSLLLRLWREVGRAEVVHGDMAGWPFPLSWLGFPIARARGRRTIAVVESSPWRLAPNVRHGWKARVREGLHERMARRLSSGADVAFFTQEGYRDSLFVGGRGRAEVTPATWVRSRDLVTAEIEEAAWERKGGASPVSVLFAGRLTAEKGVEVLLDAIAILTAKGVRVRVGIIGEGPLLPRCEERARTRGAPTEVEVLAPVPYVEFFDVVRGYHALVVPTLTQEQPRILFDAMCQAVPVIASDTPGNRPHVAHGETGWRVPVGDADALAEALARAAAHPEELARMGRAARASVSDATHEAFHARRLQVLREVL